MQILYVSIVLLFLSSCTGTEDVIDKKYDNIIHHYREVEKSEKKLKAAGILISNMHKHYSYIDLDAKAVFDSCAIFLSKKIKYCDDNKDLSLEKEARERIKRSKKRASIVKDNEVLSTQYLIKHIDKSYHAWERVSQIGNISFDMYCQYILPYRVIREPIDDDFEINFFDSYSWISDSLKHSNSFECMIKDIIKNENIFRRKDSFGYGYDYSLKQIYLTRRVSTCSDAVIYFVSLFRALGIPATYDSTYKCYRNYGHVMLALFWDGKWYSFEVPDGDITERNPNIYIQNFPKVYRANFSGTIRKQDVTSEYIPTVNIFTRPSLFSDKTPTLAMFNNEMNFSLDDSRLTFYNKMGVFKDFGVDAIYVAGKTKNQNFTPSSIIFIDSLGNKYPIKPNYKSKKALKLHRKCFLDKRPLDYKKSWINDMVGYTIEASNDLYFKETDTLAVISSFTQPFLVHYPISIYKKYQYIRITNRRKSSSIAEFMLFDKNGNAVEMSTYKAIDRRDFRKNKCYLDTTQAGYILLFPGASKLKYLVDNDGLTYSNMGKASRIVLFTTNPKELGAFAIQARNDENHILIGDTYELMMWDKGWQSLGEQTATSHELIYNDVPSNALYWLRNLSRGKEEYPFIMNNQGEQYWAGQANAQHH